MEERRPRIGHIRARRRPRIGHIRPLEVAGRGGGGEVGRQGQAAGQEP